MKGIFSPIFLSVLALSSCATPIRSTVDSYGEAPLARTDSFFFERDSLPLPEKPVADACRDAARSEGLTVVDQPCPNCKRVETRARLAGTSQAVTNSGPSFGTSMGIFGGGTAFGIGVGSGNTESRPETERWIEISFYEGKNLLRTISARSIGRENSVAAVAYEVCVAAFRNFPNNLKGKVYNIKPGEKAD